MANRESSTMPLSRFGVLVAQLESIAASASQQPPDPLLCFDLVSELVAAIEDASQEAIVQWQRKCEDALQSLLILGARRPVRRLASLAMVKIIAKGDGISIYSRASSLQGWLADAKRSDPLACAGVAQCLGELYCSFGRRITSGLIETTNIVAKMMKFHEDFVRQDALQMLRNALEGSSGSGAPAAYSEAFRIIMRVGIADKSFIVRIAAVRCLRTFASIGGPGLGVTELENACSYCVKALEDPVTSVRDAFAEALGALLALGMNPETQMKQRGRSGTPAKKMEGGLKKHLSLPFMRACGVHAKDLHIGVTLSWVSFLQVIRLKYRLPDNELQSFALQVLEMLNGNSSPDGHALACVLYILRVGVTDQMTEPTQRSFLALLGRQLESSDCSPSIGVAALRTLSYLLSTLGEVPVEFKEVLDNTVVAALSHSSLHVRIEAALTLRALAEVDPTCVGGLVSYGVTTLHALRESASSEKGTHWKFELDSLHGQATVLAALVSISPRLHLGYPGRLPKSLFEVSKKMLTEFSRNPLAAVVEKEAGWLLLASLIASVPKEELEDQVFDVLLLWAEPFGSNAEGRIRHTHDLISEIRVLSAAVEALTAFIKSFVSPTVTATNGGILLQPVLVYLSGALSYISSIGAMQLQNIKPSLDLFTIRTLTAYQSLLDPMAYKRDHPRIIQICTTPFSDPSGCEESSCLRMLLDKRDACLGPWIPGRDWFEDELRALEDGKDGVLPCVWENEISSFPQPETMSKMLVNQMLLCFGSLFATQDSGGKLMLLNIIEQCLKSGKKQSWHAVSITNICVGLLAGMKAFLALHLQMLGVDILSSIQAIFLSILAEGDICASQRRASSEGLGLLARLGNDSFTARMTRSLLGELAVAIDPNYIGSLALSLGCIHRSAGGMALSTFVPPTVSSICLLAKSSNAVLQFWSLYSLVLTIEAAGLSFVPQVQATLFLALELILSDENGWVDLRQVIGRLVNAIVAALGPELVPGSTFFSRCKSVVAETSSGQETSTLLECVRFTQQLVLFAPQAVSVHSLVQSLLPSLSSRQPSLRHLAVSTLRHLIEKDPVAMIDEQIEENLFSMLDEETDSEIGNLVRATINRLLYTSCPSCPSRWLAICRNMVLATSTGRNATSSENDVSNYTVEGDVRLSQGEDDENMISSSSGRPLQGFIIGHKREKHLRYRTRLFAAECLRFLPTAVGTNPAHFDLSLARRQSVKEFSTSCDLLVLRLQELISLAYQISTSQFEGMQPIGVNLLITIMDKFENIQDPELPGHLLLEQYQAQLVSAVRSAISLTSGPLLLEAGLQLATKVLTSSIMSGDRVALKRMFSLISRPLNEFKDLYYPSFAEWVACKIKIRLLTAHASIKCYVYRLSREKKNLSDEYLELMPLFSNNSSLLGKYWIWLLKDYTFMCLGLQSTYSYKPFLDGIQSLLVSSKVQTCLSESCPLILQATALDSVPMEFEVDKSSKLDIESLSKSIFVTGFSMVRLELREFNFLWGLALLILFQKQQLVADIPIISLFHHDKRMSSGKIISEETQNCKLFGIALLVFQCLSTEAFFGMEFLTLDLCKELLQVLMHADHMEDSWDTFAIPLLSQVVQFCPDGFLEMDDLAYMAMELYVKYLCRTLQRCDGSSEDHTSKRELLSALFIAAQKIASQLHQKHWKLMIVFLSAGYECLRGTSAVSSLSKIIDFLHSIAPLVKKCFEDKAKFGLDGDTHAALRAWAAVSSLLLQDCMKKIHMLESRSNESCKLLAKVLAFCLEEAISLAEVAHESLHVKSKVDNMFPLSAFKHCTKCFQITLNDFNIQVQTVGVLVLKSLAQKDQCESLKSHSFFLFFMGELLEDIFVLIQDKMKNPMTKESIAICEECLRLLFLFHTLAQVSECRQAATKLFLEAIFVIVSAANELHFQELNEIRTIAMRMVTYLVQLPSFASQLKDVLLSMPAMRRQQLQEIIRAAFSTQGQNTVQMKFPSPYPTIKLPVQSELGAREEPRLHPSGSVVSYSHKEGIKELEKEVQEVEGIHDDEDDDDDWDTFQSIPATTDSRVGITGVEPVSSFYSTLLESESLASVATAPTDYSRADRIESDPVSSTDATLLESDYDGKSDIHESSQIMVSEETSGEPNLEGKDESALESLSSGVEFRETPETHPYIHNETIRGEHGKDGLPEVPDSQAIRDYCEEDGRPRVIGSEGDEGGDIERSSSPHASGDEEIVHETIGGEHGKDVLPEVSDSQAIRDAKMLNDYCEEDGRPRVIGSQGDEGGDVKRSSSPHASEDDEEIKVTI